MKKRLISLLLTMCLLLTAIPIQALAATGLPFRDVPDGAWYLPAVRYAYDEKIMTGTSGNTFEPESKLTRAQMTQILYNMEGQPSVNGDAFSDVQNGDWFFKAVNWAASQGVVNGVGGGRFDPNSSITREQMVVMLCNYANYKDYETDRLVDLSEYTDTASISDYAYAPLQWAVGEGIISGVTETTIQPKGTATRAQVAQVLMTFCQNKEALDAFLAKDVDDFPGYEIIQNGTSTETDFGVLVKDTVVAEGNDSVNTLVETDEEQGTYLISNIDKKVASLHQGDILYIPYAQNDYILTKVGNIEVSGNTALITAENATIPELFVYLDMDIDIPVDDSWFDPSSADEDITFENTSEPVLASSVTRDWQIGDVYPFELPIAKFSTGHFSAALDVMLWVTARIRFYGAIDFRDAQLSVKQQTEGQVSVKVGNSSDNAVKKRLGTISLPIGGLFSAEFSLFTTFDVDASATGNFTVTYTSEFGGIYKDGKAQLINTHEGTIDSSIEGEISIQVGLGAEGGLKGEVPFIISAVASLSGEAGVELAGSIEKSYSSSERPDRLHICPICVDGEMNFLLSADFNFDSSLFGFGLYDNHKRLWDQTIPFKDFYISFGGGDDPIEFGWGACPHYQYLVTIRTEDQAGAAVPNAAITVDGPTDTLGSTDSSGTFYAYCDNGSYTVLAEGPEGYSNAGDSFKVDKQAVEIDLTLTKEGVFVPFTLTGDLYDAMDGLYDGDNWIGTVRADIVSPTEMHITLADMEPVMGLNRHTNYSVSISPGSYEWTASSYVEIGGSEPTRTSAGFYSPDVSGGSDYFTVSNPKLDTQKKQLTWTVKVNSGVDFDFSQLYGTNISAITNQKT